ncbi:MAG TPA: hypothetical protein VJR92_06040 [Gemmatimonadaceae bacterium]|nr:hypothetical protein [Gemmatimonadaceae bacterium]
MNVLTRGAHAAHRARVKSVRVSRFAAALACVGAALGACADAQPAVRKFALTEELRIDGSTFDLRFPYGFLLVNRTGQMAMADWINFHVRLFDPTGKSVANFGDKGAGPGEFNAVTWRGGQRADFDGGMVGDTVWLYDRTPRRLTYVGPSGRLLRMMLAPSMQYDAAAANPLRLIGGSPVAVLSDGTLIMKSSNGRTDAATTRAPAESYYVALAPGAKSYKVVARVPGAAGRKVSVTDPRTRRPIEWSLPFEPRPVDAVSPNGTRIVFAVPELVSSTTGKLTLTILGAAGDTIAVRSHPLTGVPLSRDVVDNYLRTLESEMRAVDARGVPAYDPAVTRETLSKLRAAMPERRFSVGQMRVGIDNSIWISMMAPSGEDTAWYIFDDTGNALGYVVHKPKNGHLLQAASRTAMWVMEYDDDGFAQIVRYRVGR